MVDFLIMAVIIIMSQTMSKEKLIRYLNLDKKKKVTKEDVKRHIKKYKKNSP